MLCKHVTIQIVNAPVYIIALTCVVCDCIPINQKFTEYKWQNRLSRMLSWRNKFSYWEVMEEEMAAIKMN